MRTYVLPFSEPGSELRLMFMDEAAFGRISEPTRCWAPAGIRPVVLCQMVREYTQVYGAVEPASGDDCFIIAPKCNTGWTNAFLSVLSEKFKRDYILLCADNAGWHKAKGLEIPENIRLFYLPPRTPEMNPIEQLWPEIRKRGFKNKLHKTIGCVVDQLCDTLNSLSPSTISSITARNWIVEMS